MPVLAPAIFIPLVNQFLAHWAHADVESGGPVVLAGGVNRASLEALRGTLNAQQTALIDKINGREMARGGIQQQGGALCERLKQFNGRVRVLFPVGRFVEALPGVPDVAAALDKVLGPMDDAVAIWSAIEAAGTSFVLAGDYARADFEIDLAALKTVYAEYRAALIAVKLARGARNETQDAIYPILKQYRQAVPTYFGEGSVLANSLPRLTPKRGHTPEPVAAQASWDAERQRAKITWEPSEEATLKRYQVRVCRGPSYDEDEAAVLANVDPEAPREVFTLDGLPQPGSQASYKVFVILTTDNERGSPPVTVTRPPG